MFSIILTLSQTLGLAAQSPLKNFVTVAPFKRVLNARALDAMAY